MDARRWGKQETRCFILFWSEESTQRKLGDSYHTRRIYEDITKQMAERGYARSWQQCQRKIKHLKVIYRKTKDSGQERDTCPFYDELDMVLGDRPSFSPGRVVQNQREFILEQTLVYGKHPESPVN